MPALAHTFAYRAGNFEETAVLTSGGIKHYGDILESLLAASKGYSEARGDSHGLSYFYPLNLP